MGLRVFRILGNGLQRFSAIRVDAEPGKLSKTKITKVDFVSYFNNSSQSNLVCDRMFCAKSAVVKDKFYQRFEN